jgi:hypothetical protein
LIAFYLGEYIDEDNEMTIAEFGKHLGQGKLQKICCCLGYPYEHYGWIEYVPAKTISAKTFDCPNDFSLEEFPKYGLELKNNLQVLYSYLYHHQEDNWYCMKLKTNLNDKPGLRRVRIGTMVFIKDRLYFDFIFFLINYYL